ncbi:Piwi domain-containing protein [Microcoleus sp. FACHB-68]|uniref:Piwi domain-containing protein n=1 Tax=Microcoleus sp. FACHB-68 TaxID=2692826 RepID=UPI0016831D23|nr:Piwi domain-containing protein [Microcoleus sp. FACHB-68]MBD1939471.1 stem cell self-renewal protein Piwi [Microcoleus sp. FACHB-68]
MTADVPVSQVPTFLSEIFLLTIRQANLMGFRLSPEVDREVGNRLSFHFCRKFPGIVVSWHDKSFWVLGKPNQQMPPSNAWKEALKKIQEEVEDFRTCYWSFQWVRQPSVTPYILAQLAFQVLKTERRFLPVPVLSDNGINVSREVDFWPETIELKGTLEPAIALTLHSRILSKENLAEFYQNHPYRHEPDKLLIGLKVQDIESGNIATITELAGTVGEHRQRLIENATGSVSKEELKNAPDNQPLVAVQFGKNKKKFHYAMAALRPAVTPETANKFGVEYGSLLKATKIRNRERQELLFNYKKVAENTLASYGIQLASKCLNSNQYSDLFWQPEVPLSETLLLFGKNFKEVQSKILTGLKKGGVYRRHDDYRDSSRFVSIAALKLCNTKVAPFLNEVQKRLKEYGFESHIIDKKALSSNNLSGAEFRVEVEKAVNDLVNITPDIVLTFLPEEDRNTDRSDEGSFYHQIYSLLLNRRIASQVIYEDTLKDVESKYILNQVVPGILAKLGNLPFVLAEPLTIADYFIGLDISRSSKEKLSGTLNACASIRLYGQRGEFHRYRLEGDLIEGEEIPQRLLERLLPSADLGGKTVLIYRDGRFCGQEVDNFLARAKAIDAKFILVECRKSHIPRLYNLNQKVLAAPTLGLALRLSSREAVLVTTQVPENVGLACPLRLTVHEQGHPASIKDVVDTTLKLTLLHHGALKTPRLPMPLYGSDRMAYLRLNGIYPSLLEGDRQFWL